MPAPSANESREDYISRCIPIVIKEGATPDQAAGKCHGMWESHLKKGEPSLFAKTLLEILEKYDPNQPRDDRGRWTDSGGEATIDADGRYHVGGNVNLAVKLLGEGKHVVLAQKRQVSTLLNKLAEIGQKAAAGEKKVYDLCRVSVPGTNLFCAESAGFARIDMPQIAGSPPPGTKADSLPRDAYGAVNLTEPFVESLATKGFGSKVTTEDASFLRPSQRELDGVKVATIMKNIREGRSVDNRLLVVSRDNYIVDGHHNWAAKVAMEYTSGAKITMPIIRVNIGIVDLLDEARDFAKDWGLPQRAVSKSIVSCDDGSCSIEKYDPGQPRGKDFGATGREAGQWATAGGSSAGGEGRVSEAERTRNIEKLTEQIVDKATKAEPGVSEVLKRYVAGSPTIDFAGFENRLKTRASLQGKIRRLADKKNWTDEEAAADIADALRYTLTMSEDGDEYASTINDVLNDLNDQGFADFGEPRNTWGPGQEYQGINMNMITKEGLRMEIQFHTPASYHTKEVINHGDYEFVRTERGTSDERAAATARMIAQQAKIKIPRGAMEFRRVRRR